MSVNPRAVFIFLATAAFVAVVSFQQNQISRLRSIISDSAPTQDQPPSPSTAVLEIKEQTERLRVEIERLSFEVSQLQQEKLDAKQFKSTIERLDLARNRFPMFGYRRTLVSPDPPRGAETNAASKASSIAEQSPIEAARWVASLEPGEEQKEAALAVVGVWLQSDPKAVANWVASFSEGSMREQALGRVARTWGLQDWNGAAAWLETLPKGASKDMAIDEFVWSADGYDIRLASEWANRIETQELRSQRVEGTLRRWLSEDNSAARAWIQQSQLPPGMGERLLSE